MPDSHASAARFKTHRPHLLALATRLLGSTTEAKDAVQEAWLRLDRAGEVGIENFGGCQRRARPMSLLDSPRRHPIHGSSSCSVVKPTHTAGHHPVQRVVR